MSGADLLTLVLAIVIGGALITFAFRMEPHWVSRDGSRFICRGQLIDDHGNTQGRWNEYRIRVTPDGELAASRRSFMGRAGTGVWRVTARSPDPPPRKAVFLLHPVHDAGAMMAVRVPRGSRAVDTLDDLLDGRPGTNT